MTMAVLNNRLGRLTIVTGVFLAAWFAARLEGAVITTLASFNGTKGAAPIAGVIFDASGNIYGTASEGGTSGAGVVYKLTPTGTLSVLTSFNGTARGFYPYSGLVADANGVMYGTTVQGGANGAGVAYKITTSGTFTRLVSFGSSSGYNPYAGLLPDQSGNFYGTTPYGGPNDNGVIYKLTSGGVVTPLAYFDGITGYQTRAGLYRDASGNLFGVSFGGTSGDIFELTSGGTLSMIYDFDQVASGLDGYNPNGTPISDGHGNLYGTLTYGTDCMGVVYKYNLNTHTRTNLAEFHGANGATPWGALVLDAAGNLYGTTYEGGAFDKGTVFKIDQVTGALTTLVSFNGTNGANPYCNLTFDAQGNLYGTTSAGGATNQGTVFKISGVAVPEPSTWCLATLGAIGCALAWSRRRNQA